MVRSARSRSPETRIYLAAPYLDAPRVRALEAELAEHGITCASRWAHVADGPEALDALPLDEVRKIALSNDRDLLSSQLVVALARDGAGAEMFAEVRLALAHRIPVIWVGTRRPLSAYREGVHRATTVAEAKVFLLGFADVVKPLSPFEKKKARELLWDLVEKLGAREGIEDEATVPRLWVVR